MCDISHQRCMYHGYLWVGMGGLGVMSQGSYSEEMAFGKLQTKMNNWRERERST